MTCANGRATTGISGQAVPSQICAPSAVGLEAVPGAANHIVHVDACAVDDVSIRREPPIRVVSEIDAPDAHLSRRADCGRVKRHDDYLAGD